MTTGARLRPFVGFVAIALLSLFISAAQAQAPVSIAPKSVKAGTTATLTISTNGFFNLSQVSAAQISVSPRDGVSNARVSNASAQSLMFTFDLAGNANPGQRALVIDANDVTVSMKLMVERDPRVCSPACRPPRSECRDGTCVAPACTAENCRSPRSCFGNVCRTPRTCVPRCSGSRPICDDGTCVPLPR